MCISERKQQDCLVIITFLMIPMGYHTLKELIHDLKKDRLFWILESIPLLPFRLPYKVLSDLLIDPDHREVSEDFLIGYVFFSTLPTICPGRNRQL